MKPKVYSAPANPFSRRDELSRLVIKVDKRYINLGFGVFEGSWSAFVSERLAYFRLKRTKSIAPVATAAR